MYLLIHEDFTIEQADQFDESWQEAVAYGVLSVLVFENGKFLDMDPDGQFVEVPTV